MNQTFSNHVARCFSLVPLFLVPTIFGSLFIFFGSALNIYSQMKLGEIYHFRRSAKEVRVCQTCLIEPKVGEFGTSCEKWAQFFGGQNPEGRFGRIFFGKYFFNACFFLVKLVLNLIFFFSFQKQTGIFWVVLNISLGIKWFVDAENGSIAVRKKGPDLLYNFTVWVPIAKFFGVIMNLQFTVVFIPVSRLFMQYIYRISTGSQTVTAKIWRGFLEYTCGLDYALEFHMLCGITGYFCAIMHTFAHVMNFATRAEEVWSKFGWWIWFTGIGLLTCLTILVSAAHRNVRRNHFYIFYYTHMLYWPITFFNFFHGAGYFGPNFWKFAIIPIGIFVLDRLHRVYKERIAVSLIDFTNMGVVTTISLGKESMPEYSEGHYAFVNCPHVSEHEWHPFTISSAPQGKREEET